MKKLFAFDNDGFTLLGVRFTFALCFLDSSSSSTRLDQHNTAGAGSATVLDGVQVGDGGAFNYTSTNQATVDSALNSNNTALNTSANLAGGAINLVGQNTHDTTGAIVQNTHDALLSNAALANEVLTASTKISSDQAANANATVKNALANSQATQASVLDLVKGVSGVATDSSQKAIVQIAIAAIAFGAVAMLAMRKK